MRDVNHKLTHNVLRKPFNVYTHQLNDTIRTSVFGNTYNRMKISDIHFKGKAKLFGYCEEDMEYDSNSFKSSNAIRDNPQTFKCSNVLDVIVDGHEYNHEVEVHRSNSEESV